MVESSRETGLQMPGDPLMSHMTMDQLLGPSEASSVAWGRGGNICHRRVITEEV